MKRLLALLSLPVTFCAILAGNACSSDVKLVEEPSDAAVLVDSSPPPLADVDQVPPDNCTLPALKLTAVAQGFRSPVVITSPANDSRLFIVEQGGDIRVIKDGALVDAPFLDLTSTITFGGERGLLGLAFHPAYAENGRFWVTYTAGGDAEVGRFSLAEYKVSASDPDKADLASGKVVFSYSHSRTNHNGGGLAFGPDGFLYISTGDGGGGGDPDQAGQRLNTPAGKLLRVDVDTYPTPPPGNFTGNDVYPHIWDYGLRNAWRFSFDRLTGDLYIGDVGQNAWEEIDFEPKGQGNKNYGWSTMEGNTCYNPATGCNRDGLTLPVAVHPRSEAKSITGGYVYRGAAIPCLRGRYIYADYITGRIFSFVMKDGAATDAQELTSDLNPENTLSLQISSFGEDRNGELYLLGYGSGRVYRIDAE